MTAHKGWRDFSMVFALAGIAGFFALSSPQFLGSRNLSMLAIELSITATLALGMLLVILPGQIDLSAGSGVGLLGGIASVLIFSHGWPAPLAMLASLVLGIVVWYAMGSVVVRERMPSFIITLGGLLVFKGLFWLVINNRTVPVTAGAGSNLYSLLTTYYLPRPLGFALALACAAGWGWLRYQDRKERLENGLEAEDGEVCFLKSFITAQLVFLFAVVANQFRGVPLPFVILGLVAACVTVLTEHTPFGRHLYAIGGNEEAAVVSGIPVERTVITAFAIMGAIVAVTGFMQTAYAGASTTTVGDLMELDAVAACVIGGTSLKGGRGTAFGVLFGALIMATLLNGMTLLAVAPEFKYIARGAVLALAVWLDVRLSR
ncbi:MAG: ATPase [Elusimicrobia bacterium]|nr:ATPase [Elusimicrobiota bacterium]